MSDFNKVMRSIRMMRGIKQQEIAQLLNVKQQSISKIEIGLTLIQEDIADKIASYFGFKNKNAMQEFYNNLNQLSKNEDLD